VAENNWREPATPVDFFTAKADVWTLLQQAGLNPDVLTVSAEAPPWYHPGQSGAIRLGKNILAQFGVLHPQVLKQWDIDFPVAAFEIFTDNLPPAKAKKTSTKASLILNPLQPVTRDFAFVVSNDIAADMVLKAAKNVDKNLITNIALFDVYAGKGMAENHRSLAFTITLQPTNNTLTDAEIETVSKNIVTAVEKIGGQLRG
ncbi:MAG: phenylalanine--tRNA ligase subunit beta, partial [Alphaproteobacteria bacterium]|nr:phenylalanine--tRNA ligase subunit beta [Alphaproteobacteria bacterium]